MDFFSSQEKKKWLSPHFSNASHLVTALHLRGCCDLTFLFPLFAAECVSCYVKPPSLNGKTWPGFSLLLKCVTGVFFVWVASSKPETISLVRLSPESCRVSYSFTGFSTRTRIRLCGNAGGLSFYLPVKSMLVLWYFLGTVTEINFVSHLPKAVKLKVRTCQALYLSWITISRLDGSFFRLCWSSLK